jgi:hypothetical protein
VNVLKGRRHFAVAGQVHGRVRRLLPAVTSYIRERSSCFFAVNSASDKIPLSRSSASLLICSGMSLSTRAGGGRGAPSWDGAERPDIFSRTKATSPSGSPSGPIRSLSQ